MKKLLHTITALMILSPAANAQSVSGALTTSSPLTTASGGGSAVYYFHAYALEITTPGDYTVLMSSDFDSYGQFYSGNGYYYEYPMTNLLFEVDDSVGVDFGFRRTLSVGFYTVLVTTFSAFETGSYTMSVSGPASVTITDAALIAGTPLPLTVLDFTVDKRNNSAALSWTTANEDNVSHFEIEKSIDGIEFIKIGSVDATGNNQTGRHTYSFTDAILNAGNNMYRLKVAENDGTFGYSKTINLISDAGVAQAATLYPNPAHEQTMFSINSTTAETLTLNIVDLTGKIVIAKQQTLAAGSNFLPLDLTTMASGTYMLQWTVPSKSGTLVLSRK